MHMRVSGVLIGALSYSLKRALEGTKQGIL